MKTRRIDLSKGCNVVMDKSVSFQAINMITMSQSGYVTIADGVDLRTGSVRQFNSYNVIQQADTDAHCIFSYRNKFYTSSDWRDYVVETISGQDRIYYSSYSNSSPQKTIEEITVPLGIPAPLSAPLINDSASQGIILSVSQSSTGGVYTTGTNRSYRVAVETLDGVQIPSQPQTVVFSNPTQISTHSATISWNSIPGAIRYWVFAGESGSEKLAIQLGISQLSVTDDGSFSSGELASNYDDSSSYQYFYTFERNFKGMIDESGPSPVSLPIQASLGRQIIFDTSSDGFFSLGTEQTISSSITTVSTIESSTTKSISNVNVNQVLDITSFTINNNIGLLDGEQVYFNDNPGEPYVAHLGDTINNIIIQDTVVSGGVTINSAWTMTPLKTYIEWTIGTSSQIQDEDLVHVVSNYNGYQDDIYEARIETPSDETKMKISIPYYTYSSTGVTITSLSYIPGNAYIVYRNLYRTTPAGGFLLVDKVPIWQSSYQDGISSQNLGNAPTSYYTDNGITIIAAPPPNGLTSLTSHYGMLFGIDGMKVRWTPVDYPDYWPEVFYQTFPSKPVALASFAQALIVLCEDDVFRLNGSEPTQLSLTKTHCEDGCIAPHSVQRTTEQGLLFLSRKGLISFDGMHGRCITDHAIPARFWQAPSYGNESSAFIPTLGSYNYAALAYEDSIRNDVTIGYEQHMNHIAPGVIYDIKSFLWNGKYFMYWTNMSSNYGSHTCVCIDLKRDGLPITTLPMKLIAACTNEVGRVFAILSDAPAPEVRVNFTISKVTVGV